MEILRTGYHSQRGITMNTTFTHRFHKAIFASAIVFGITTLAVLAQSPPATPAKPVAAPAITPTQINSAPAVAKQTPAAPVRIAPAQQPVNGQVGNNPLDTNQSVPTKISPANQPAPQQPVSGQVGNNPLNYDESVPTSQIQTTQMAAPQTNQAGTTTPAGVGYNNQGGIVDSNAMQGAALNQVHYHYHYDSSGQPIGNAPAGYAQEKYENPDKLSQNVNSTTSQNGAGGMYAYQDNNINPNSRVGPGGNGGGAGVNAVWNPYMNNGSGMLTYASAGGGVEGFND